jgi:hypothetical protein
MNNEILHHNVVISGDVVLMPIQYNGNIEYNILKECEKKYNNTLQKLMGGYVILLQVKNIKLNNIPSIVIRESNNSASRFFCDMVVRCLNVNVSDTLHCTIIGMNRYFIEASISLTKRAIVFIVIDSIPVDKEDTKFSIEGGDVIVRATGNKLAVGDNISVVCNEIINNEHDLVFISDIVEIID